ncbi:MAG: sn-glycerol-3-phosphate ABC transporter ATP-binding protein UgpC [Thermomicrobiales bacterium]|nr:sn-glycerol-3-phosphate ABC transporter ATP-binding protein UgpC [Thermomicrobiales bacterium]
MRLLGSRGEGRSAPVSFERVCKRFGAVTAVDDLSLEVPNGEMLVLLGPSGCGKTTSLRMLAGLESITGGTIRIGETVVNALPPRARDIAMVFQSYALYSHLTVYENLAYPLRVRKLSKAEIDHRVRDVAQVVQIEELLDRKPRALSGGQRQRVALGRAIIRRPAVFLMDEPLSNLDAKLRLHTRGELKRFQRELATTTIYVTHDQAEAMTLADRVAIMNGGVLQQVGPPKEVYARPASVFVAGFLGSPPMNLLAVEATSDHGAPSLRIGETPIPAGDRLGASISRLRTNGNAAILGVRPEDVVLHRTEEPGSVPSEVFVVEDLGNERLVTLNAAGQYVVARVHADAPAEMGDRLWFAFDPGRAHLFDPLTERRVD